MRNDVVLDAVVYLAGDDASIDEVVLGAVRTVPNDACCPGARHARNLEELLDAGRVDVDARFGRGWILKAGLDVCRLSGETRMAG